MVSKRNSKQVIVGGQSITLALSASEPVIEAAAPEVAPTPAPAGWGLIEAGSEIREIKDAVRITLPNGSYPKGNYIYTPEMEGKTRWFDQRLINWGADGEGIIWVEATKASVKARGFTLPEQKEA